MLRIVPDIAALAQRQETPDPALKAGRPSACPHCRRCGLWGHGDYPRKVDRNPEPGERVDPIPIPRFFCRGCRRTCSCRPAGIAPRRWYGWAVQDWVLQLLLVGCSLQRGADWVGVDRHTVRRWWQWLRTRSDEFGFRLRSRFPELGRAVDFRSFWCRCLERMGLGAAMGWLEQEGVRVP